MAEKVQQNNDQIIYELVNRIRVLESKQNLFSEKLLVMNQNMIEEYKKVVGELKKIRKGIQGSEDDLENVKNVVRHLTEEAGKFAIKDDVRVLEKYINLWDPLNFVTEKDVMELIKKNA